VLVRGGLVGGKEGRAKSKGEDKKHKRTDAAHGNPLSESVQDMLDARGKPMPRKSRRG
jgi:hypothetical protein